VIPGKLMCGVEHSFRIKVSVHDAIGFSITKNKH